MSGTHTPPAPQTDTYRRPVFPDASRRALGLLAATALTGMACFTLLALSGDGTSSGLATHDPAVARWAVSLRTPALTALASPVTDLGSAIALTVLTTIAAAILALRGRLGQAALVVATMLGAAALSATLKLYFGRERPPLPDLLGDPSLTFAFPSGHSLGTAAFATVLACLVLLEAQSSRAAKTQAVLVAAALTLLVGMSRIYLGYHWLTDVLAGWSLGMAWACTTHLVVLTRGRLRAGSALKAPQS